jgi:hypothetical protein
LRKNALPYYNAGVVGSCKFGKVVGLGPEVNVMITIFSVWINFRREFFFPILPAKIFSKSQHRPQQGFTDKLITLFTYYRLQWLKVDPCLRMYSLLCEDSDLFFTLKHIFENMSFYVFIYLFETEYIL